MKNLLAIAALLLASSAILPAAEPKPHLNSPVNQVFQFMFSGTRSDWADHSTTKATAYLWVPEHTRRLRGLIIMGTNVPEQMLVGHPAIRAAAAANDLGIVWSTPSFHNFKTKTEDKTSVAFLQDLLDGLAQTSGYPEVATIPWLPMGESGHLLMVDEMVELKPERCIAGIWLKNPHLPPHNRTVPALVIYGSAQEWGQDKVDITKRWNDLSFYDSALIERKLNPDWALTLLIDGTSGHFDVSERLVQYLAHYIDTVAKARLSADGSPTLKPIDITHGLLADLPVPHHEGYPVTPYTKSAPEHRAVPWFFDSASATEAQSIAAINWKAETQIPGFVDASGKIMPFDFNGISSITPQMEPDGITFHLHAIALDRQPETFFTPGAPLAKSPATPQIEWLCGAVQPLGNDRFQVALDRGYRQQAIYLAARIPGTDTIRGAVQPIAIKLQPNNQGSPQKITFQPIPNVKPTTKSIPLTATSDSGLPVRFFVVAGPAIIEDNRLIFTPIPPSTRFPVTVTVAAWQWGRSTAPAIKTAETVRQSFQIIR